jgi:hypothetical protein
LLERAVCLIVVLINGVFRCRYILNHSPLAAPEIASGVERRNFHRYPRPPTRCVIILHRRIELPGRNAEPGVRAETSWAFMRALVPKKQKAIPEKEKRKKNSMVRQCPLCP